MNLEEKRISIKKRMLLGGLFFLRKSSKKKRREKKSLKVWLSSIFSGLGYKIFTLYLTVYFNRSNCLMQLGLL